MIRLNLHIDSSALVRAKLAAVFTEDEIEVWLRSPQPLLDGRVPLEMIADGELVRVLALISQLEDGTF
jgi:hypothetical protein